jgi:hypothetical protein
VPHHGLPRKRDIGAFEAHHPLAYIKKTCSYDCRGDHHSPPSSTGDRQTRYIGALASCGEFDQYHPARQVRQSIPCATTCVDPLPYFVTIQCWEQLFSQRVPSYGKSGALNNSATMIIPDPDLGLCQDDMTRLALLA